MNTIKVQSANKAYLIFAMFIWAIIIFLGINMADYIMENPQELGLSLGLSIPLLLMLCMGILPIIAYRERKEIEILVVEKQGTVNFDELRKEYVQIKDTEDKLYFVKIGDEWNYQTYELFHDISK